MKRGLPIHFEVDQEQRETMKQVLGFIVCAVLVAAAAGFASLFMPGTWYDSLVKPPWTPPDWVFGPVWSVLYIMIAIAGWLALRSKGFSIIFVVWLLALVFNAAWSWLMFGENLIGWALVDIIALLVAIVVFIGVVWPFSKLAALLFVPYAAWVGYATSLNFAIWMLNS